MPRSAFRYLEETIKIPQHAVGGVIGKQGATVKELQVCPLPSVLAAAVQQQQQPGQPGQ